MIFPWLPLLAAYSIRALQHRCKVSWRQTIAVLSDRRCSTHCLYLCQAMC